VADVLPDQVRGTTFLGTYEGDALGGVGDAHALTTLWTVEHVYAGGPLPQRFSFQTPACAWVNLTPGTRYLFSTSVRGLDGEGLASGQPSVADSLAWEVLADGAVRLAPFDTYQVSDYDSEELRVISTFEDALWSVAPDAGDGDAPVPGSTTDFGCTASASVASPEQARGTTFVGTYLGDEVLPGPGEGDVRAYWSVQRVYAGAPLPELLTLRSNGCAETTLEPGRRYLFSTADALSPSWPNSLAWELADDDSVHLAPFADLTSKDLYGPAAQAPMSIGEALAAVAAEAGDGMPPVRAGDRTPG
jgi:hypothetical protein